MEKEGRSVERGTMEIQSKLSFGEKTHGNVGAYEHGLVIITEEKMQFVLTLEE